MTPTPPNSAADLPEALIGAIMGAAYDFRDAHISGSANLKQSAHSELEFTVRAAMAGVQPAPAVVQVAPTVEQVEDEVSMGHGAWDLIDPEELIDAVLRLATPQAADTPAQLSAPTMGAHAYPPLPEPDHSLDSGMQPFYRADQLRAYVDADRAALAAQAPVAPAVPSDSVAPILRAMAINYTDRHSWDRLDTNACNRGALEIEALCATVAASAQGAGITAGPLDSLALMKVVMQADEALSGLFTKGTTNWAAAIGKAVQRAVIAAAPQPATADAVRLEFAMVNGMPMERDGLYRYHGFADFGWHPTKVAAIDAALAAQKGRAT